MSYSACITAEGDPNKLFDCLKPEIISYDRSSFTIEKTSTGIKFLVESKDPVALRATLNSISQLLKIYHDLNISKKPRE